MKNICIIGFGRFGKLAAKMLAPFGRIFVIEKNKVNGRGVKQIEIEQLGGMDWVIFAVPISELKNVLQQTKPFLKKGCLVTDVCSVKVWPCKWMSKILGKDVEILGTHPMFGPDSAKYGLKGLQVILCPLSISRGKLAMTKKIFKQLGLKVVVVTPKEHDKQAAKSLALVHYLGRALGKMKVGKQQISTLGFERLLAVNETVTNDTWQLFFDMQQYNPYAGAARKQFRKSCEELEKMIGKNKGGL